jgi:hypothetical protein
LHLTAETRTEPEQMNPMGWSSYVHKQLTKPYIKGIAAPATSDLLETSRSTAASAAYGLIDDAALTGGTCALTASGLAGRLP